MNSKHYKNKNSKNNKFAVQWSKLTIANNFMFKKVFSNKELCLELLRLILPELDIKDISFPVQEREIKESADGKGVRLDLYTTENRKNRVYDLEMQVTDTLELPKRSRYNAGMMDQTELEQGKHYSELPDTIVIFICPFDLFHKGMYRYTFREICVEDRETELQDGTMRVFLNAKGTKGEISQRLKDFLQYIVDGRVTEELEERADNFLMRVDQEVQKARLNRKWRVEYMNAMLYLQDAEIIAERRGEQRGVMKERQRHEKERQSYELELQRNEKMLKELQEKLQKTELELEQMKMKQDSASPNR